MKIKELSLQAFLKVIENDIVLVYGVAEVPAVTVYVTISFLSFSLKSLPAVFSRMDRFDSLM